MVTTTCAWAAIAFSVDGCDASAAMSGQDCALSPNVSRTASNLSSDRPASAMRASPPDLARYSAVSFPAKPVAPYRTMSNSRRALMCATLPEGLRRFDVLTQDVTAQECGHHLVPDLGVLRREHPVILRREVQELVRTGAVLGRG